MRWRLGLTIYRLLLPVMFLAAFPGWIVKMLRRGGLGSGLHERLGVYGVPADFEPCGAIHIHSVSVGETQLALKLIRHWRQSDPDQRFVIATGTATGHALAMGAGVTEARVTYAPLDFPGAVGRYLDRFEPAAIVFIEGEVWPHLVMDCKKRGIGMHLVNARFSPRSARRFARLAAWVRPMFARLTSVCIQETGDEEMWKLLGVNADRIHRTGSLKFDPENAGVPRRRAEFQEILERFGKGRPVVMASSTHPGEEGWIAKIIRTTVPGALPVIVPRHAERREEVACELRAGGFDPRLRSLWRTSHEGGDILIIDSTGELGDWTAHADVVIIGKSFWARGGQNPCEAIQAGKPVIVGPQMDNFQPLTRNLLAENAILEADDDASLGAAICRALDSEIAAGLAARASAVLDTHSGATGRIIQHILAPQHL